MIDKDLEVELDSEVRTLEALDWAAMLRVSEELAARAAGLSQDRINELHNTHRDPANEIYEYFLDDDHCERVEAGQWLPFGVLGIGYRAERYEEIEDGGLLVFDLERTDGDRAPVLWIRDGEVSEVAGRLDDLRITPAEPS